METDPLKTGLPENLEAERLLIGLAILEPEQTRHLVAELRPDDFSLAKHQQIWHAITDLVETGTPVDSITLVESLRQRGTLGSSGGALYLTDLLEDGVHGRIMGSDEYIRIVRDKSALRRILFACRKISYQCLTEDADVVLAELDSLRQSMADHVARGTGGMMTPGEIVEAAGGMDKVFCAAHRGVQTPWAQLNRLTLGLHPGQMIVLAGRTGRGKSAAMAQIADYATHQNAGPVALFSFEMTSLAVFRRIASARADVDASIWRRGELTREQRDRLQAAVQEMENAPSLLHTCDRMRGTVSSVYRELQKIQLKAKTKRLGLVCIDYLQLMGGGARVENRQQEITAISRGLKQAAVEFNVPLLVVCQYNREADKGETRPMLHHIRESGAIGHDADMVWLLHEPEGMGENGWPSELFIEKQREGATGKVRLWFDRKKTKFVETD